MYIECQYRYSIHQHSSVDRPPAADIRQRQQRSTLISELACLCPKTWAQGLHLLEELREYEVCRIVALRRRGDQRIRRLITTRGHVWCARAVHARHAPRMRAPLPSLRNPLSVRHLLEPSDRERLLHRGRVHERRLEVGESDVRVARRGLLEHLETPGVRSERAKSRRAGRRLARDSC